MERPSRIVQMSDYCEAEYVDEDLLWATYCKDNYEIEYTPQHPDGERIAAVYFSSNGLYCRGKTNFYDKVVVQNRYEWKKNRLKNADIHIFVRDVFCASYYYGINNRIDCIDKLKNFLHEQLKDYKMVVMLGASAGGYAAVLLGSMLGVSHVFSFSGQFDKRKFGEACRKVRQQELVEVAKMVSADEVKKRQKYEQIASFVRNCNVPVYYFVGSKNLCDRGDCDIALSLPTVRVFRVDNAKHGIPLDKHCLRYLINMDFVRLESLYASCRNKVVGDIELGFRIAGLRYFPWFLYFYTKKMERLLRRLFKKKRK